MMNLKKTGLFLQVRLNSCRMPGKALIDLHGKPLIARVMERLSVIPADVRALLTSSESLPLLKPISDSLGWDIFAGSSQNVLKRYADAALYYNVDIIIRATGDNPLLSSEIAMETLDLFNKKRRDLAYLAPIPYGSGVEVISREALLSANENARLPYQMEHVTPYIYDNKDKFIIACDRYHDDEVARSDVRITIDTREDYERLNYLLRNIGSATPNLSIISIARGWDGLKFEKFRRALIILDGENVGAVKLASELSYKLSSDFNIFASFKKNNYEYTDLLYNFGVKYVEYDELSSLVTNEGSFDRIAVIAGETNLEEMRFYKSLGPVVSFGDAGEGGEIADIRIGKSVDESEKNKKYNYYFDESRGRENITSQEAYSKKIRKILVNFIGEDYNKLTRNVSSAFVELGYDVSYTSDKNTAASKTDFSALNIPAKNVPSNSINLNEFDIIATSFNWMFFECVSQGKPVILITSNPVQGQFVKIYDYKYHISDNDGAGLIEELKVSIEKVIELMKSDKLCQSEGASILAEIKNKILNNGINNAAKFIGDWSPSTVICPYCCDLDSALLYRNSLWNMYKCPKCGLYYTINFNEKQNIYVEDYFFDEYKRLYGKTYEEDRENIRKLAINRINILKKYINSGSLLDFGSGMGFFAEYAEEKGYKTTSIDVSSYAVEYMKNKLGLNAICADQSYLEKSPDFYDVITSFYAIEHIKDFEKMIFLFYQRLNADGVLVLSTPNAAGFSVKWRFEAYIEKHPQDHYRIYSTKFMKSLLKKYNFKNIKINITGIHPERMVKNQDLLKFKPVTFFLVLISKLFHLGDTFEIYARKK